jgi:hypothetical protein
MIHDDARNLREIGLSRRLETNMAVDYFIPSRDQDRDDQPEGLDALTDRVDMTALPPANRS